jgi:hypothetical protein
MATPFTTCEEKMKRPANRSITRAFPHPQEPYDNWFDRHPFISGGLVGAVFALMMYLGLVLR